MKAIRFMAGCLFFVGVAAIGGIIIGFVVVTVLSGVLTGGFSVLGATICVALVITLTAGLLKATGALETVFEWLDGIVQFIMGE